MTMHSESDAATPVPAIAEAPACDPAEQAGRAVAEAIDALTPVLEEETAMLKAGPRLETLTPVIARKDELLERYERAVADLRAIPDARARLPETLRVDLLDKGRRFDSAMRANLRALDYALVASRKVMEAILGAARALKGQVEVYGRKGAYATPGGPAPVAVDRAL